ncbi:OmpA-OmpF porin, OOP family [Fontimonas thermophila]|uniref:OmpA-OmpF porin, OOP family n=1 Tax=Fontimonas thermophila TaxID=1076937 RepID=A0A1I2J1H1_9GAMM|nr:OmpA family protein [Fontimonas thermophila]SFF48299.1 OmpA-OmpF porin, OOP family [Fontimonas thermophila]
MRRTTGAGVALILGVLAPMAVSAADEMRPYVTGGYSYVFEDDDRVSDEGQGFFLGAGKALSEYWGLEFGAFHGQFDKAGAGGNTWREYGGRLDSLFFYSRDRRFSPYVGLGIGAIQTDLKSGTGSSTDPFGDIGVGFFKYFDVGSGDIGMRADVRYRWVGTDELAGVGDFEEPVVRIGLVAALGPKAVDDQSSGDADGDGVPDASDQCPGTPKGTRVDTKGCPLTADSDGDGVPDAKDKCPGTSKGLAVDADGCPVGKSGKGFRVIGEGSELRFEDVHFAFDRSDLSAYAQEMLDDAAKTINSLSERYPTLRVKVDGHTDWTGTEGYNMGLGERRANAVKQYLMRKGVAGDRIDTTSFGESKPVAPNTTAEGRAANRRAEVRTTAGR